MSTRSKAFLSRHLLSQSLQPNTYNPPTLHVHTQACHCHPFTHQSWRSTEAPALDSSDPHRKHRKPTGKWKKKKSSTPHHLSIGIFEYFTSLDYLDGPKIFLSASSTSHALCFLATLGTRKFSSLLDLFIFLLFQKFCRILAISSSSHKQANCLLPGYMSLEA